MVYFRNIFPRKNESFLEILHVFWHNLEKSFELANSINSNDLSNINRSMTSFSTREILASRNSWGAMSRAQRWLRRGMCRLINIPSNVYQLLSLNGWDVKIPLGLSAMISADNLFDQLWMFHLIIDRNKVWHQRSNFNCHRPVTEGKFRGLNLGNLLTFAGFIYLQFFSCPRNRITQHNRTH